MVNRLIIETLIKSKQQYDKPPNFPSKTTCHIILYAKQSSLDTMNSIVINTTMLQSNSPKKNLNLRKQNTIQDCKYTCDYSIVPKFVQIQIFCECSKFPHELRAKLTTNQEKVRDVKTWSSAKLKPVCLKKIKVWSFAVSLIC